MDQFYLFRIFARCSVGYGVEVGPLWGSIQHKQRPGKTGKTGDFESGQSKAKIIEICFFGHVFIFSGSRLPNGKHLPLWVQP